MRYLALCLCLIFVSVVVQAQITTGPVTTSMKLAWNMDALAEAAVTTPAEAQALTYTVVDMLGTVASSPIPVGSVICLAGTPFTCSAALSSALVTSLNRIGQHSVTLSAANASGASVSLPFLLSTPLIKPPAPTAVKITP